MLVKLSTFKNPCIDLDGAIFPVASIKPDLPKNRVFTIRVINDIWQNGFVKAMLRRKNKEQMHIIELER